MRISVHKAIMDLSRFKNTFWLKDMPLELAFRKTLISDQLISHFASYGSSLPAKREQ